MKRVSFKRSDGTSVTFKAKTNPRTYETAKKENMAELAKNGWKLSLPTLKVPYATSPDGLLRLYFKPQAIYFSKNTKWSEKHEMATARSIHFAEHYGDIRTIKPEVFAKLIEKMYSRGDFDGIRYNPSTKAKKTLPKSIQLKNNPIPPLDLATNIDNFKAKTKVGKPYSLMTGRKFVPVTTIDGMFRTDVLLRDGKGADTLTGTDKIKERAFKQINLKSNPGNVEYMGHKIHIDKSVYTVLPYMKSFSGPTGFVQAKKWIKEHVERESKR